MWQCEKCREQIEETFEVCWSCGTSKDGLEDPSFQRVDEAEMGLTEAGTVDDPPAAVSARPSGERQAESVCPKCGARQIVPAVRVVDRDGEYADKSLSVRLDRNPEAWIFKSSETVELRAHICGRCGYAELYAANPAVLWSAYQKQKV